MIIALGESIVVTGATTSELPLDAARMVAFGLAFLSTAALWWLYFSYVAAIAQRRLELSHESTKLARDGYTYLHVVIVAGIIVSAVGDEIVIAHPLDLLSTPELVAVAAGPAIYLLGHVLFGWDGGLGQREAARRGDRVRGRRAHRHRRSGARRGGVLVAVLVVVIGAEYVADRRRRDRGEPSPMQRLEVGT